MHLSMLYIHTFNPSDNKPNQIVSVNLHKNLFACVAAENTHLPTEGATAPRAIHFYEFKREKSRIIAVYTLHFQTTRRKTPH